MKFGQYKELQSHRRLEYDGGFHHNECFCRSAAANDQRDRYHVFAEEQRTNVKRLDFSDGKNQLPRGAGAGAGAGVGAVLTRYRNFCPQCRPNES